MGEKISEAEFSARGVEDDLPEYNRPPAEVILSLASIGPHGWLRQKARKHTQLSTGEAFQTLVSALAGIEDVFPDASEGLGPGAAAWKAVMALVEQAMAKQIEKNQQARP